MATWVRVRARVRARARVGVRVGVGVRVRVSARVRVRARVRAGVWPPPHASEATSVRPGRRRGSDTTSPGEVVDRQSTG